MIKCLDTPSQGASQLRSSPNRIFRALIRRIRLAVRTDEFSL